MTTPEKITAVMALPTSDVLAAQAQQATAMIVGVTISSDSELQLVIDDMKEAKAKRDKLEALRLSITRPMDQAKGIVMDLFRAPLAAMDAAIEAGKQSCLTYTRARDRRLAAEQAERERVAQAERDRLAAEARALQDKAAAAENEQQAQRLRDAADVVKVQAITTVAPILPTPAKVAGAHTQGGWNVDVADGRALARWMLANEPAMFDAVWTANLTKLRSWVTLHNGAVKADGLTVTPRETMVLR